MKKADFVLIAVALVIAAAIFLIKINSGSGSMVKVDIKGKESLYYSLDENAEYVIEVADGYNVLVIDNGEAYVSEADCANQVCVKTSAIKDIGSSIICMPHGVAFTIVNDN